MSASLSRLRSFYGDLKISLLLHAMIKREFSGNIAVLALPEVHRKELLESVAAIDPSITVFCIGGAEENMLAGQLGFTHVNYVAEPSAVNNLIEEMALLAIISPEMPANRERIMLDADGVFRIYPYAQGGSPPTNVMSDWSV